MKKNKDIFVGIAFVAVVIAGFVLMGWSGTKTTNQVTASIGRPSSLTAREESFDFGTVSMARGNVTHDFVVKNIAPEPITITKLYTSCMCTEATIRLGNGTFGPFGMPGHGFVPAINKIIAPGEEATVSAIFNPAAHGPAGVGRADRIVYVENSSGNPLELKFSALVTP